MLNDLLLFHFEGVLKWLGIQGAESMLFQFGIPSSF
jgi:hypothetical protein